MNPILLAVQHPEFLPGISLFTFILIISGEFVLSFFLKMLLAPFLGKVNRHFVNMLMVGIPIPLLYFGLMMLYQARYSFDDPEKIMPGVMMSLLLVCVVALFSFVFYEYADHNEHI